MKYDKSLKSKEGKELFLKRWSIAFWNDNEKIGELKFTNEGLKFTGETNKCAKNFFDVYLKEITNDYIKKIKGGEQND